MNWQTLTVEQYQLIMQVQNSDMDAFDKEINICSMLSGKTPTDIEAMELGDYTELKKKISFVFEQPPQAKAKQFWKGYRFIYDVRKINTGRFKSVQTFLQGGIIDNLHNLAACIIKPAFGKYKPELHEKYAEDMKGAPLVAILSSMLFFCQLFEKSVEALVDSVEMTPEMRKIAIHLKENLDGLFTQKDLPSMKESV